MKKENSKLRTVQLSLGKEYFFLYLIPSMIYSFNSTKIKKLKQKNSPIKYLKVFFCFLKTDEKLKPQKSFVWKKVN